MEYSYLSLILPLSMNHSPIGTLLLLENRGLDFRRHDRYLIDL